MTVGLPGAGIGGIFYLLSALAMPVHALTESALRATGMISTGVRRSPPWSLVWRQFFIALAIIAALWVTGWVLATLLLADPRSLGTSRMTEIGHRLPNILKTVAIIVSIGTLVIVLATVQLARLVVAAERNRNAALAPAVARAAIVILFLALVPAVGAQSTADREAAQRHITTADRAFADEDTATARREYEAALRSDPGASRPLYKLGQLARFEPVKAESYFRRYVAAEPADAWGWVALGQVQSLRGRHGDASVSFSKAYSLEPGERDVVISQARAMTAAGHTDDAIAAYERWTADHLDDAEAMRELAVQRRRAGRYREAARAFAASDAVDPNARAKLGRAAASRFAAPSLELFSSGSRDSDQNQAMRASAVAGFQVGDRARVSVAGGRRWLSGFTDATVNEGVLSLFARPLAAFRLEVSGGLARPHSTITTTDTIAGTPVVVRDTVVCTTPGNGKGQGKTRCVTVGGRVIPPPGTIIQTETESAGNIFTGGIRSVYRQPGGRSSIDVRATRSLLDATSVLVANRVVRSELAGRADVELLPRFKLRAGARAGAYNATGDDNTRVSLLGGLAVAATDAVEISGVFQTLSFSHPTTSGYFAPELAQLAEVGSYAEFESEGGMVLAIDAGAGLQRLAEFGSAMGNWGPSYRLFASLDIPLRAGSAFHVDLDSYDSRLGSDAPSASGSWRSFSLAGSVKLALW